MGPFPPACTSGMHNSAGESDTGTGMYTGGRGDDAAKNNASAGVIGSSRKVLGVGAGDGAGAATAGTIWTSLGKGNRSGENGSGIQSNKSGNGGQAVSTNSVPFGTDTQRFGQASIVVWHALKLPEYLTL